jgi:ATP-dependent protease ClpP protease subunit
MSEMNSLQLQNMRLPPLFPMEPDKNLLNYEDRSSHLFRLEHETWNAILKQRLDREPGIVTIYGNISEITADYVRTALLYLDLRNVEKRQKMKPGQFIRIDADINTFGGLVSSSFGIATRLFNSGYYVAGIISEHGFSGGGLILQGCHHRAMEENAQILVHYCRALALESEQSLAPHRAKMRREDYARHNDRIINWIARRIVYLNHEKNVADREKELRKLFMRERYLYPDEALHYHLIDEIVENFPKDIPPPDVSEEEKPVGKKGKKEGKNEAVPEIPPPETEEKETEKKEEPEKEADSASEKSLPETTE